MAGPLSGIAGGQVPLTQTPQTNQQNNTQEARTANERPANAPPPPGESARSAPVNDSQRSEGNQQKVLDQQIQELLTAAREDRAEPVSQPRGSLVDITI